MPVVKYSEWVNEENDLSSGVIDALLSNEYSPQQVIMLYATGGKASTCFSLNPKDLELLAVAYYKRLLYKKVVHAGRHTSTDGGLDVWLQHADGDIEGVQCKQYSVRVGKNHVIKFARALQRAQARCGYFWSPSGFSSPAVEYAAKKSIELYDGEHINKMVHYVFEDEVQYARELLMEKIRSLPPQKDNAVKPVTASINGIHTNPNPELVNHSAKDELKTAPRQFKLSDAKKTTKKRLVT